MSSRNRAFKFPVSILIGSTPSNIVAVTKGYLIDPRYYLKILITYPIALIFQLIHLCDRVIYRKKIKSVSHETPPLFVIGFWRSGTTLLHSLLCQDPKAAYVTTFQGVFPNLVLSEKRWLKAFINKILPDKRPFDSYPMDMDFPQEEEFALMSLQPRSIYKFFYFPKDFDRIYENDLNFEQWPDKDRSRWIKEYEGLIRNAKINTGGERYISKNPCNIFRIKTLAELYPDARFVFIYRNPYQVVESLTGFANQILPGSELQHLDGGLQRESFARLYRDSLKEYESAKQYIRPGSLMEIRYEDFIERPVGFLRNIYSQFNIPGVEEALPLMEAYLERTSPESRKSYGITQETYRLVNEYAAGIVQKLGYKSADSQSE